MALTLTINKSIPKITVKEIFVFFSATNLSVMKSKKYLYWLEQLLWCRLDLTEKWKLTTIKVALRDTTHGTHTVKWKEPNRPQRPNRPQFLEGRFGTCWVVLDRKGQNSSRWYQFGPSNFWIGYTKSYFGTSSQFGPSDGQIKIPIWPQQGLCGATAFCRQKERKELDRGVQLK